MSDQIDPALVEAARAFATGLLDGTAVELRQAIYSGPWLALSARRVLEPDGLLVEAGDELVVLIRDDAPLTAMAEADWNLTFAAGDAMALRGRLVDGRWAIVGVEDVAEHLETLRGP